MPSVFDGYPYSNTHQLNLDWIIAQIKQVQPSLEELKTILENLKDINAVVEEAENASKKASAAAESAEKATERINSATVNGVPVVNNPVLDASNVGAVPDSATVNGTPVVDNPVLDASDVGAVPDSATVNGVPVVNNPVLTADSVGAAPNTATVNGIPILDNPVLTAASVGAAPYATVSVQASASVKIATSGNFFVIGRLTAAQGTTGVYAVTAYSENRAPHVVSLAAGEFITVSTGGSDNTGWYVEFTNTRGAGTVLLAVYGGFKLL